MTHRQYEVRETRHELELARTQGRVHPERFVYRFTANSPLAALKQARRRIEERYGPVDYERIRETGNTFNRMFEFVDKENREGGTLTFRVDYVQRSERS